MLTPTSGQMYDWITHTHKSLGGECPHACIYCSVNSIPFGRPDKYKGEIRIIEKEMKTKFGSGNVIFIESCNDLFAKEVPIDIIERVVAHCRQYPDSAYVFQTKNPKKYLEIINTVVFPPRSIFGVTIETNRDMSGISKAPKAIERYQAMVELKKMKPDVFTFVTIEPVLDFDVDILAKWITDINPNFLNLGADSKNHNLPEPTVEKIYLLVQKLAEYGIELREKHNLARLKEK